MVGETVVVVTVVVEVVVEVTGTAVVGTAVVAGTVLGGGTVVGGGTVLGGAASATVDGGFGGRNDPVGLSRTSPADRSSNPVTSAAVGAVRRRRIERGNPLRCQT